MSDLITNNFHTNFEQLSESSKLSESFFSSAQRA